MPGSIRAHYDAFPDPSPNTIPIGPGQLDRIDDALHFGWAWHRFRFAFRRSEGLRILDAGCGTGLSTLNLARLNPGATVVGVDVSPVSLDLARRRAEEAGVGTVSFIEHDLEMPLPGDMGPFDYVVARNVLGNVVDPGPILNTLVRVLDARGLLNANFPSATGRMPARQLRRAIEALVPESSSSVEQAEAGLELLQALRSDHPIRRFDAGRHGANVPSIERFVATYLNDRSTEWTLESATEVLERAGLKLLYAVDRGGWKPDRVFGQSISAGLRDRVAGLSEPNLAQLKDALDISLHPDSYIVYACRVAHEPHIPAWPDDKDPAALDRLIPRQTGLSAPAGMIPDPASGRGRVTYRTANGGLGELESRSDSALRLVDGKLSIGQIEATLGDATVPDTAAARRTRWLDLANFGFVLLESPDPRQNIDCIHLGPVKDRLDCACPRRWVRGCERHGLCTITTVGPDDLKAAVLSEALARLGVESAIACDRCPDYSPED
jgi:ubiquinone/menaquinone biosynthesis C-methylase UbiE